MGHIRLGRIPKTKLWAGLFDTLATHGIDTIKLSKTIAEAAAKKYSSLESNQAINYCFWILVRIASASRSKNFTGALRELGINIDEINSGIKFVQEISKTVQENISKRSQRTVYDEMAELSLREVLSANIIEESRTLFGTNPEDIKSACIKMSKRNRFGIIAKEFFSQFMCRSIQFITDKEVSNYIGPEKPIKNNNQLVYFREDLYRYCYETSKIIEDFADGWFSKHSWESNNKISEKETSSFTSYALKKLQMELQKGTE